MKQFFFDLQAFTWNFLIQYFKFNFLITVLR